MSNHLTGYVPGDLEYFPIGMQSDEFNSARPEKLLESEQRRNRNLKRKPLSPKMVWQKMGNRAGLGTDLLDPYELFSRTVARRPGNLPLIPPYVSGMTAVQGKRKRRNTQEPIPLTEVRRRRKQLGKYMAEGSNVTPEGVAIKAVNSAFGRNSKLGRLTPEKQSQYITREYDKAIQKKNKAVTKINRLNAELARLKRLPPDEPWRNPGVYERMPRSYRVLTQLERAKSDLAHQETRLKKAAQIMSGEIPPPDFGPVKNAITGAGKEFSGAFIEDIPKGLGGIYGLFTQTDPERNWLYGYGDINGHMLDEMLATDEARSDSYLQKGAELGGDTASYLVPGNALKAAKAGTRGTKYGNFAFGALKGGAEGLDDAIAFDATTNQKLWSFAVNAGMEVSEFIPINQYLRRLNQTSGGAVQDIINNSAATSIESLLKEIAQTGVSNLTASGFGYGYDPDRPFTENMKDNAISGGIVGAVLGGGGEAIDGHGRRRENIDP